MPSRPVSTLRTRPAASCRPGKVLALREPTLPYVRVDSDLAEGMVVSSAYDPVMAHGRAGRRHQHRIPAGAAEPPRRGSRAGLTPGGLRRLPAGTVTGVDCPPDDLARAGRESASGHGVWPPSRGART